MPDLGNREEIERKTDEDPDIETIKDAYTFTLDDLNSYFDQTNINFDTRNNLWAKQNLRTGRKHGSDAEPAFPWEDASDLRPFVIDTIINENVALLVESLLNTNLTAVPVEGNDIERAKMVEQFMHWQIFQEIKDIRRQATILANFQEEKAIGAAAVLWDTRIEEEMKEVSLDQILNIDPENPTTGEQIVALIQDKERINEATDMLQRVFRTVSRRKARKMVFELRNAGITKVGMPAIVHNRAVVKALSVDEDFFYQPNVIDIQDAPYVFHAEYLTPEQLRAKVKTDGWNKEWVDTVIETTIGKSPEHHLNNINSAASIFENTLAIDVAKGFVRVVHGYEKATTEDGIPGVFITAFHPDVEGWGMSGLLNYKPSRYPFVLFPREYRTRRLMDTKSVPELGKGHQDEIKIQMDSRADRTTLATIPPRYHQLGRKPSNWGPGDSIGVRRRDETGFMPIPEGDIGGSVEIEQTMRNNMSRMFGRTVDGQNEKESIRMQQFMVDTWLTNWKEVFNQVWDLHQQFGEDSQFFRVIGSNNAEPMEFIRSSGTERVDFYLDFSVLNSDAEQHIEKLKLAGDVMSQFDRSGSANFDEYMKIFLGAIDSSYPERLIRPTEVAVEKERKETQDDIAKISSGLSVNAPENANVDLRMQVLNEYIKGTEDIPANDIQQRRRDEPEFNARLEKYVDQLQFQKQQQENAVIGRIGTKPGNALPSG